MILASRRGATFTSAPGTEAQAILVPTTGDASDALSALSEVAQALGYDGAYDYNHACTHRPEEVRERLAAL